MEIVKLHCLGNEYYLVRAGVPDHPLPTLSALISKLPVGGAKGLVVLSSDFEGQHRVELYNFRGIRVTPEACALRCAACVLGQGSWNMETVAGVRRVDVRDRGVIVWFSPPVYCGEYQIGRDYHGYLLNIHHRYFITLCRELPDSTLSVQGQALDRYFGGADTVFVRDGEAVEVKIWQKGTELPASSSGACAAAAVLWRLSRKKGPMKIVMPGGTVTVARDGQGHLMQVAAVKLVETLEA